MRKYTWSFNHQRKQQMDLEDMNWKFTCSRNQISPHLEKLENNMERKTKFKIEKGISQQRII